MKFSSTRPDAAERIHVERGEFKVLLALALAPLAAVALGVIVALIFTAKPW